MGTEHLFPISILRVTAEISRNSCWQEWTRQTLALLSQSSYSPSMQSVDQFLSECASESGLNEEKKAFFLALDQSHQVIGFIQLRYFQSDADLDFVVIDDSHRRRGIAQRLLAEAFDWIAHKGVTRILLEVGLANSSALALYKGLGFVELARRKKYYHTGEDAIVMELML